MIWGCCARTRICPSTAVCSPVALNVILPRLTCHKVNAASKVENRRRISLAFRSSQYLPQMLLGRDVSATLPPFTINLPQLPGAGWVDTTYVDDDIRVARAFGGNLFVLARV